MTCGLRTRHALQLMETERLWALRDQGDAMAREELTRRFLPLARRVARRYAGGCEQLEDLVQVASVGLLEAIERFEPARGYSFGAFAVPTMVGEVKRYYRTFGWAVHVSRRGQERALRIRTATYQLQTRLGRVPSAVELAQYMELELDELIDGLQTSNSQYAQSLEGSVREDPEDPLVLHDTLGEEEDGYGLVDATSALADLLPKLPHSEREALMISLRENLTQVEIGRRLGCSQMQISRLIHRGRDRLRELLLER